MFQYCESINSFIHAYLNNKFNKQTKHAAAELSKTKVFTCVKSKIKDQISS